GWKVHWPVCGSTTSRKLGRTVAPYDGVAAYWTGGGMDMVRREGTLAGGGAVTMLGIATAGGGGGAGCGCCCTGAAAAAAAARFSCCIRRFVLRLHKK